MFKPPWNIFVTTIQYMWPPMTTFILLVNTFVIMNCIHCNCRQVKEGHQTDSYDCRQIQKKTIEIENMKFSSASKIEIEICSLFSMIFHVINALRYVERVE